MKKIMRLFFRAGTGAGVMCVLTALFLTGCGSREAAFLESAANESAAEIENAANENGAEKENTANENEAEPPGALDPSKTENEAAAEEREAKTESEAKPPEQEGTTIYVDVCGAVKNPGVYEMEGDSRIFQAIDAAGGLLPEAAAEYVNRADFLSDGQQIYIPTREETETDASFRSPLEQTGNGGASGSKTADASGGSTNEKINLNTADEAALTTLTGIGASKAQAILAYREEHGGFSAIEEILNVPGIKEGTFAKIKDRITAE